VVQHNDLLWKNLVKAGDRRKPFRMKPKSNRKLDVSKTRKGAHPVNLIIELPGPNVIERGHGESFESAGKFVAPVLPGAASLADI